MTHELKIQKQWADAKLAGEKPFEIRRNDRWKEALTRLRSWRDHWKILAILKILTGDNYGK